MSKLNVRFPGFKYTTKGPTVIDAFIVKAVSNYDNKELTLYDTDGDTPLATYTNKDLYIPTSSNKCVLFTPECQQRKIIHTRTKSITKNISSEDIGAYFNAESEQYINEQEKTIEYRYVITRESLSESLESANAKELSSINSLDDDNLELNVFENSKNEKIEKISDDINALFTVNVATVPQIITFTFYLYTQLPEDEEITPNEEGSFAYIGSYEVKYNPYARDTDLVVTVAPSIYMYLNVDAITTKYSVCKRKSEFSKELFNQDQVVKDIEAGSNYMTDYKFKTGGSTPFDCIAIPGHDYNDHKGGINSGKLCALGMKTVHLNYSTEFIDTDIVYPQIKYLFSDNKLNYKLESTQAFEPTQFEHIVLSMSSKWTNNFLSSTEHAYTLDFLYDDTAKQFKKNYPYYIWPLKNKDCSDKQKYLIYSIKPGEIFDLWKKQPIGTIAVIDNSPDLIFRGYATHRSYKWQKTFNYTFDPETNKATIKGDVFAVKDPLKYWSIGDLVSRDDCKKAIQNFTTVSNDTICNFNTRRAFVQATYESDPKNQSDYTVVPYIMQNGTEESQPNVTWIQNLNVFETDGSTTKAPIDSFNKIIKTNVTYDESKQEEIPARSSFQAVDSDNIPLYQGNSVIKFTADQDKLYIIKVELVNSHVYNYIIHNYDLENPVVSSKLGDIKVQFQSGAITYTPLNNQLNKAYYIGNGAQAEVAINFNITPEDSSSSEDDYSSSSSDSVKFPDPVYSVAVYQADSIEEFKSQLGWPKDPGLVKLTTVKSKDEESVNQYDLLDQCIVFNQAKVVEESNWILYDEQIGDTDNYKQCFIPYVSRYMFVPDKCVETRGVYQMAAKNVKDFQGQVKIQQVKTQINS